MNEAQRFADAMKQRERLTRQHQQLLGRYEEARRRRQEVEADCRGRGIDPDNIDQFLEHLREVYSDSIAEIERCNAEAAAKLKGYTE